jgi:hypothetical protein
MLCSNTVGEEHCIGHKHYNNVLIVKCNIHTLRGRRGRDRIVVGFTATYGIIAGCVNYKTGELDSKSQVIKFTSYLPMIGGSLRVVRLLPPLKLVAMI